ncbi:MAG: methyltransferase [Bacteroidales bacterium]|nr:methyltransferase [Bacteroidales bacterium]
MNSRERILSAINHQQPDRVPVDLGATGSSGISVVAYQNLLDYLGKKHLKNHAPDVVQQCSQPDMEILDLFGVDVVDVGRHFNTGENYWHELELIKGYPALYPKWFKPEKQGNGSWLAPGKTGEYIGKMPAGATFFDQLIFPYIDSYPDDYKNLGRELSRVVWGGFGFTPYDWADEPNFWEMLREKNLDLRSKTDKALLLGVGCNLFEWGTFLRRIDNFMMDLYLDPENVNRLLDVLMERHMAFLTNVCKAVGDIVDILKFGDDFGTNTGPFIPTETYHEFFFPRHKQMCDYVKANSSAHTMLHSCGGIYELIPELIDAGFEILNPVQINAINMEPERLKREFGRELTFWGGGCDTKSVLNRGTPQEIKDHVKHNLEVFTRGGGFIFNTVHNIMPDVPPENITAMFEAVKEFNN